MIGLDEAYKKIKEQINEPIIYLSEDSNYFIGSNSFYVLVDKKSGEVLKLYDVVSFIIKTDYRSTEPVYYQAVFDDFLDYYRKNSDEKHLASLYASVWFQVFYDSPQYNKYKTSFSGDELLILEQWSKIEQILYDRIISIINRDNTYYPPCVLKNFDDHFFRIKPFMLRYGYTDNGDRIWVKEAARLTAIEAYSKFRKKYSDKTDISTISDYGDFYLCGNSKIGDMDDDGWEINPFSGEIRPIQRDELTEKMCKCPNENGVVQYRINDLLPEEDVICFQRKKHRINE